MSPRARVRWGFDWVKSAICFLGPVFANAAVAFLGIRGYRLPCPVPALGALGGHVWRIPGVLALAMIVLGGLPRLFRSGLLLTKWFTSPSFSPPEWGGGERAGLGVHGSPLSVGKGHTSVIGIPILLIKLPYTKNQKNYTLSLHPLTTYMAPFAIVMVVMGSLSANTPATRLTTILGFI